MSTLFGLASGGIGVMPDPADNPDNHDNPHHKASTRISFERQSEVGYASLGRLNEEEHTALVYMNPGSGQSDHSTNTFTVE